MARLQRQTSFLDYEGFTEKFKPKKTTDDCYTPGIVYDAILDYVKGKCPRAAEATLIKRPFYPGGDFEKEDYPEGAVVVDNPPFSILAHIIDVYCRHNIPFWLFAPHLTLFNPLSRHKITAVVTDAVITYENKAKVNTSFLTNMWPTDSAFVLCGELKEIVEEADRKNRSTERDLKQKKIVYPKNVVSSALLGKSIIPGLNFEAPRKETAFIRKLDCGQSIFGSGLLTSDRLANLILAEQSRAEQSAIVCKLSVREKYIIDVLNNQNTKISQ